MKNRREREIRKKRSKNIKTQVILRKKQKKKKKKERKKQKANKQVGFRPKTF